MDRQPTDPGFLTPELNALRIQQLQRENETLRRKDELVSKRLEIMGKELTKHVEKLEQLKESRDKLGKRLGSVEGEVADLRAWKRLLFVIGTVGALGLGALFKGIVDALVKGG